MNQKDPEPYSEEHARALLALLSPGSDLISITIPTGSFSNFTHVVEARSKDGNPYKIVVRRYKVFGDYDRGEKARREFKTFELLNQHKVPAPQALFLDEIGDVLGLPGIVTGFVPGSLRLDRPSDPLDWARKLAQTLAKIHSIPCGEEVQAFLLKGNAEASWFLRADAPPGYMQEYPGGADLWHLLQKLYPTIRKVSPVLLHIDYWSGNILWLEDEISAVIDWEEAAYGDPAVDLGYARMNMCLMGLPKAAYEFLRVYESQMGSRVENIGFWELAACVRPMIDPEDWMVAGMSGLHTDLFLQFIAEARKRTQSYLDD
jgi:aminoglycoside phosphotransferase (APT) family kinase protein